MKEHLDRYARIRQIEEDRELNLGRHKGGLSGMQDTFLEVKPTPIIVDGKPLPVLPFRVPVYRRK